MKLHIISETMFVVKGTGVHTAFLNHVDLMKEQEGIDVVVNGEGTGDLFHSHSYFLYYFWKGRKYKGRRIFTAHVTPDSIIGAFPVWKFFMPFIHWGLTKAYSYADVCIAVSPNVEEAIIGTGAKTKIVMISNPIDVAYWKRNEENRRLGRRKFGYSENDFIVLGVGQLEGCKGVEDFIEIAETVVEAKFIWAGGRPFGFLTEGRRRINRKLKEAGGRVKLTGQISMEEMRLVYAASDLMIFPSYHENCPLSPLEAAASGMPVIFRDLEAYKKLYKNPYLKAHDKMEFVLLTDRMITDRNYYYDGLRISEQLVKQFDKNKIRAELTDLYKSLIRS